MKITVVIPAYNAAKTIGVTLAAAAAIDWPDKEIIVVDDGSADDTAGVAGRFHGVMVIRQNNGGPAKARNTGWRAASGEVVFFTDADCVPHRDVLSALAPHFADPAVAGAGGTYGIANGERLLSRLIHAEIVARHARMAGDVDFLGSFNCAFRRAALEKTGGFDETFLAASGEDNDLSYRMVKTGSRLIFDRRAVVAHFHETSLAKYLRTQYRHGIWRMKIYRNHRGMMKGDAYAGKADLAQPPLALLLLCGLPLPLLLPAWWPLYGLLLAVYILLQFPLPLSLMRIAGWEALLLTPVTFLRGFARGLGLAAGTARFLI